MFEGTEADRNSPNVSVDFKQVVPQLVQPAFPKVLRCEFELELERRRDPYLSFPHSSGARI